MYGLMKAHTCSRHRGDTTPYRLHYCGACKTMGRLYGQKSRFLLNHDAVFLAELLTTLSPDSSPPASWDRAYLSYNCFALPETPEEMPLSLQIAASATLLMTEFKLEDQVGALLIPVLCAASPQADLRVEALRCEYLMNPLGIDVKQPRLSWKLTSGVRGRRQSAYQILVASTLENLRKNRGDLWDSGRVNSDQSTFVVYKGRPLLSGAVCHWKVRVWDNAGAFLRASRPSASVPERELPPPGARSGRCWVL